MIAVVETTPARRPGKKCPAGFAVSAELRQWAAAEVPGIDIDTETAKLRDHTFGTARSDWPGTWRNWMRKAAENRQVGRGPPVNRQEAQEARNRAVGERWLAKQEDAYEAQ